MERGISMTIFLTAKRDFNQAIKNSNKKVPSRVLIIQKEFGYEVERQMGQWQLVLSALMAIFLSLISLSEAPAQNPQRDWALTLYSGRLTDAGIGGTATFDFKFENAYFIDLALSRRLYTFRDYFDIEIEGQIAKQFGDQDNWEFNLVSYIRWLAFPWDAYLDTSFAAGAGVSYATSVPKTEAENHDDVAGQFLGALMFELAFSPPRVPQWGMVIRLHHRSGAGGTFSGVSSASNALGIGIRYSF
jgi:hypothetical protein